MHTIFWLENLKERDYSEDLGVDERIILEWILKIRVGRCQLDASGSRYGPLADSCDNDNIPSSFIKGRESS
jgi:hypothetical protein